MAGFNVLSDADVQVLQQLVEEHRSRQMRPINRPAPIVPLPTTPDVYVALTPVNGIPALVADKNVGTSTGSGTGLRTGVKNTPGYADCQIYMVVFSKDKDVNGNPVPDLFPVGTITQRVFNLGEEVAGDVWKLIKKDRFGVWWTEVKECEDGIVTLVTNVCDDVVEFTVFRTPCLDPIATYCITSPTNCCPEGTPCVLPPCDVPCLTIYNVGNCPCINSYKIPLRLISNPGDTQRYRGVVSFESPFDGDPDAVSPCYGFGWDADSNEWEADLVCDPVSGWLFSFYMIGNISNLVDGIILPVGQCEDQLLNAQPTSISNSPWELVFLDQILTSIYPKTCCGQDISKPVTLSFVIDCSDCTQTTTGTGNTGTGGTGTGGGCSRPSFAAGTAATSSPQTTLTMSVTSLLSGMLIVNVASLSEVTGVTFDGNPMTKGTTAGGDNLTQWYLQTGATTTNVVATVATTEMIAMNAVNLPTTTGVIDTSAGNNGSSNIPNVGATFNDPCEYLQAAFLTVGTPGTWGGGFTNGGQDVTFTADGTSYTLTEGYGLNTSIDTLHTATLSSLPTTWYGVIGGYP